eukprot:158168_1
MVEVTALLVTNMLPPLILVFVCWALVIHTIVTIYKHWEKKFKKSAVTSVLTIISMLLFASCMIWCSVLVFAPWSIDPADYQTHVFYGAYVTFSLGRSAMFLLFLGLIHYTFSNTKYDYPKWVKILYLIPSILVPITLIIMTTYDQWIHYDHDFYVTRRYLDHANTIVLLLFSLILFARVLGRVAWKHVRSSDSNNEKELAKIRKFLDTITKYTILVSVVIFFACCVMVMDELTWKGFVVAEIQMDIDFESWILIVFILYYIDCFVNIFCVYLRFAFASPTYDFICSPAHKCCMRCVVGIVEKKYKRYKGNIKDAMELSIKSTSTNLNTTTSARKHDASVTLPSATNASSVQQSSPDKVVSITSTNTNVVHHNEPITEEIP